MDVDLNADLGEGAGTDAELMPLVTSANVCCGAHAGDPLTIWSAIRLAVEHKVTIGAHPGYPDRERFGRVELPYDQRLWRDCEYQVGALVSFAKAYGGRVKYLKPHGAWYNQACRREVPAAPLLHACEKYRLPLVGLAGCPLRPLAEKKQVRFVPEGFADRRYRPDGTLVPRAEPGAVLTDPKDVAEQALYLVGRRRVRTLCVHGDTPDAVGFVRVVREALVARGHRLKAFA